MYRVSTDLDVGDFLVDDDERRALQPDRTPREQLFVKEEAGGMRIGLFVEGATMERLRARDPRERLDERNLADFMLALEGVSHFVYLAHRARAERVVSAVELELQAEVDKFAVGLLVCWDQTGAPPADLRERLFHRTQLHADLSQEERSRYALANDAANEYAASLEARYVRRGAVADMLSELRRFYQQGLSGKLDRIKRAA
jgi:hypothetical protein